MKKNLISNYRKVWKFLSQTRRHILFAALVFFLFAIIGFIFPVFFQRTIINFMQSISDRVSSFGPLELIGYIILNNARASFLAIALGFLAGIFPVLVVITNGYLLGFVARYTVNQQGALVLWKLLPHGVFELPAVIMSAGVGIYLGMNLVSGKKNLGKDFIDSIRFFIFIVIPLLIIAGIIEGTLIHLLKG